MNKAERNIKPFDGAKYSIWKFRIRALLDELDVLWVVDEKMPDEVDDNWKRAERCAKGTLIKYLSDSFINFAINKNTARDILQNLDAVFERKSLSSQLAVRRSLLSLKLKSGMTLLSHLNIFDELASGAQMDEMDKLALLLLTLPSSYNDVINEIETLPDDSLTFAFVKKMLLEHEKKYDILDLF